MAPSIAWTLGRRLDIDWSVSAVRQDLVAAAEPSLIDLSEADLVAACLEGLKEAFDLIVERHRRSIYQLCYRFVGNHEDASDLTQEVFLRVYRGLKKFRGHSSLSTWLYRIGVNVSLNRVGLRVPQSEPIEQRHDIAARN